MGNWNITPEERNYLRELAKKQLEYAMLPSMKEREESWYRHNELKGEVPMVYFETWTFENDLLPALKCTSEAARGIELQLNRNVLNHEQIGDDAVVSPWFAIGWNIDFKLFNIRTEASHAKDSQGRELGHKFIYHVIDMEKDVDRLEPSSYSVDRERTMAWKAFVEEIFGDILPARFTMGSLGCCLSQDIVHLMGMENMIYALVDYPDEFHRFIGRIRDDYAGFMRWLEKEELLIENNTNNGVGNGTFGFSRELPPRDHAAGTPLTTKDVWGFMDSQETVSISPDMFREFFFPYYQDIAKNFGLLSYGCCEPVHPIWEPCLSKLPNLRKISISPWCDEAYMGRALAGSNVIFHRKPSPNYVGVGKVFDEAAFSEHILKTLKSAQGCKLEFSFRDIYTLEGGADKPRRAVEIVRNLIDRHWK